MRQASEEVKERVSHAQVQEVKEEQKAPALNLFKFFKAKESNQTCNEQDAEQTSFLLKNRPFCELTEA